MYTVKTGNCSHIKPSLHVNFRMLYENVVLNVVLFSRIFCGASKGFIKASKAFRQPFVAPQRGVKIKIKLIFSLRPESEREGLVFGYKDIGIFAEISSIKL